MEETSKVNLQDIPFSLSPTVTHKNGKPCIELRSATTHPEIIKHIILAAIYKRPLLVIPKFRDDYQALAILQEKGIMHQENGEFFFTI
jgi:hypothetical protein